MVVLGLWVCAVSAFCYGFVGVWFALIVACGACGFCAAMFGFLDWLWWLWVSSWLHGFRYLFNYLISYYILYFLLLWISRVWGLEIAGGFGGLWVILIFVLGFRFIFGGVNFGVFSIFAVFS